MRDFVDDLLDLDVAAWAVAFLTLGTVLRVVALALRVFGG